MSNTEIGSDVSSVRYGVAKKGVVARFKNIDRIFAITVLLPTIVATVYYGLIASDVYVSESRFIVRSAEKSNQAGFMGALLQGTGLSKAQDDTYPVIDYIQSRDALSVLNKNGEIAREYGEKGDFASRYLKIFGEGNEALWKYYSSHIVNVDLDTVSSITTLKVRSFSPQEAKAINERLLNLSEGLINKINERATKDAVTFSQGRVNAATEQAKSAAAALAAFRNSNTVFDPDKQSATQLVQVAALQKNLFDEQAQLAQLEKIAPKNPQINALKTSIEVLTQQIARSSGDVTGKRSSLSTKAAAYARLELDAEFTSKELASAMTSLENARAEAQRQQLYLERIVQPNEPDMAVEPRRLRSIAATLIVGLVIWGIVTIFVSGVKEHRN